MDHLPALSAQLSASSVLQTLTGVPSRSWSTAATRALHTQNSTMSDQWTAKEKE
jgi:hypothetical protein